MPEAQDKHLIRVSARRCPLCRPYFSTGFVCGFVVGVVGLMIAANWVWR